MRILVLAMRGRKETFAHSKRGGGCRNGKQGDDEQIGKKLPSRGGGKPANWKWETVQAESWSEKNLNWGKSEVHFLSEHRVDR